jgi:hypothetical protein
MVPSPHSTLTGGRLIIVCSPSSRNWALYPELPRKQYFFDVDPTPSELAESGGGLNRPGLSGNWAPGSQRKSDQ